jgi:predicted nucleotidyltransferase
MRTNDEPLKADGLDEAIIGTDYRTDRVIYSIRKCIRILMRRDNMTYEEALEYLEFNTLCAYVGEGTPIFLNDIDIDA